MQYSYRCPACGVFTVEQSMKDEPIGECPSCAQPVKRIIGKNINVIYRTTGFYSTDNKACAGAEQGACCATGAEGAHPACAHCEAQHSSI